MTALDWCMTLKIRPVTLTNQITQFVTHIGSNKVLTKGIMIGLDWTLKPSQITQFVTHIGSNKVLTKGIMIGLDWTLKPSQFVTHIGSNIIRF